MRFHIPFRKYFQMRKHLFGLHDSSHVRPSRRFCRMVLHKKYKRRSAITSTASPIFNAKMAFSRFKMETTNLKLLFFLGVFASRPFMVKWYVCHQCGVFSWAVLIWMQPPAHIALVRPKYLSPVYEVVVINQIG